MSGASKYAAIIAGLLIVAAVALFALLERSPRHAAQTEAKQRSAPAAAATARVLSPSAPAAPEMDPETGEMLKTKTELQAVYAQRKADLPAEVAKPIDKDIGVIEGAAADLLAALAHEPDNQDLKRMLVATYRNEMRLLKKVLHLSSEETADEPDETAATPAASEPKQIVQ